MPARECVSRFSSYQPSSYPLPSRSPPVFLPAAMHPTRHRPRPVPSTPANLREASRRKSAGERQRKQLEAYGRQVPRRNNESFDPRGTLKNAATACQPRLEASLIPYSRWLRLHGCHYASANSRGRRKSLMAFADRVQAEGSSCASSQALSFRGRRVPVGYVCTIPDKRRKPSVEATTSRCRGAFNRLRETPLLPSYTGDRRNLFEAGGLSRISRARRVPTHLNMYIPTCLAELWKRGKDGGATSSIQDDPRVYLRVALVLQEVELLPDPVAGLPDRELDLLSGLRWTLEQSYNTGISHGKTVSMRMNFDWYVSKVGHFLATANVRRSSSQEQREIPRERASEQR